MKQLVIFLLVSLCALVTQAQREVIKPHFYSAGEQMPGLRRVARYADSARIFMQLMLKAKTIDSATYYNTGMNYYRYMESWRQHVVTDSAWRMGLFHKQMGWHPYGRTGPQDYFKVQFLNTSDAVLSCPGEYVPIDLDYVNGTFYSHFSSGIPVAIPGAPSNGAIPVGGPHNAMGITKDGRLFAYGQWVPTGTAGMNNGSSSMVQITTDSLGNYLDSVIQCFLSGTSYGGNNGQNFWNGGFVTTTGKGYVMGEIESGIEGNGTWGNPWAPYPVQVTLPGGRKFKKMLGGYYFVALATDGTLWTWGGGGNTYWLMQGNSPTWKTPGQVPLPAGYTATDIASNGVWCVVTCLDASGNQHLMGSGQQNYDDYLGWPTGSGHLTTSIQDISSNFYPLLDPGETTHKIAAMSVNSNATYFIMDNGWMYGWGGTPCGELGIGSILNFNQASGTGLASWYFWNFSVHVQMQIHPARIMPGKHNLMGILSCQSNSFYITVYDSTLKAFSAGRNKGQAQIVSIPQDSSTSIANANPTAGTQGGQLPDSWNERDMTPNNAGRVSKAQQVASPYCMLNPTDATKCGSVANGNYFPNPAHGTITGTLSAIYSNGTITVSAAGKSASAGLVIMRMRWSQLDSSTAPSYLDLPTRNINTLVISTSRDAAIHAGTYNLGWMGITNASDTLYDSIQVVANVGAPVVTITGQNPQNLYLPHNATSIATTATGTAVGTNGATIASTVWTQVSGPNTATIVSPASLSTSITGLIAGQYQFKLTATDSNGNTASATLVVNVLNFNGLTSPAPLIINPH